MTVLIAVRDSRDTGAAFAPGASISLCDSLSGPCSDNRSPGATADLTVTLTSPPGDVLPGLAVFGIPFAASMTGPETNEQCLDAVDSDGDTKVNDGCLQQGDDFESNQCDNSWNDDGWDDATINDGCPGFGPAVGIATPEGGYQCENDIDDDPRDDRVVGISRVNDGCPAVGSAESGAQCLNNVDDDGDGWGGKTQPSFT